VNRKICADPISPQTAHPKISTPGIAVLSMLTMAIANSGQYLGLYRSTQQRCLNTQAKSTIGYLSISRPGFVKI